MNTAKFITPDGTEVEVPQADAAHFDAKGWKRAGDQRPIDDQQQEDVPNDMDRYQNNKRNNRR